ncbi:MAG: hypothetical protein N2692_00810 [Patescibacteria group bacterium]|jgi:hypothetical protein|nr:hypothetical protein [Patescibacteria group bacterium]
MSKNTKLIIIIVILIILVVGGLIFILKINKSGEQTPTIVKEVKTGSNELVSLIEKNQNNLKAAKEKYDQKQLKEALDIAIVISNDIPKISDELLKLSEQIKQLLTRNDSLAGDQKAIILQLAQYQINALNNLKDYCTYADLLKQGIAAEYEAELDKKGIDLNINPAGLLQEMENNLTLAKQNLTEADKIMADL